MRHLSTLDKAKEAAIAAETLLNSSLLDSAASRAYYAVFSAARAALIAAGVSAPDHQWSHQAIQGGFAQLTRRRKLYSNEMLVDLTVLLGVRLLADYGSGSVSSKEARSVVKKARQFVDQVTKETAP